MQAAAWTSLNSVRRRSSLRTSWVANAVLALASLAAMLIPRPADAVDFGCRIGKPSYCFKYGQTFCLSENEHPDRDKACVDWTAACLACYGRIPECLGGDRPAHSSPLCKACTAEWLDCMHTIDKAYWPNRRKRAREAENGSLAEPGEDFAATTDGGKP